MCLALERLDDGVEDTRRAALLRRPERLPAVPVEVLRRLLEPS